MKKLLLMCTLLVVLSLCACGKSGPVPAETSSGDYTAEASETLSELISEIDLPTSVPPESKEDEEQENGIETAYTDPTVTAVGGGVENKGVYVTLVEQNSIPGSFPEAKADKVRVIIGRYKMDKPSWDNLPDYSVIVDGVYYSYESESGIITRDDTHADMLTDSDRRALNKIIGVPDRSAENRQQSPAKNILTDTFIVKENHGSTLFLARYDRNNGEYKEGLYACDYGKLDGSDLMEFNVGDVLTVRYDEVLQETYPYGMTVYEIYPAAWN